MLPNSFGAPTIIEEDYPKLKADIELTPGQWQILYSVATFNPDDNCYTDKQLYIFGDGVVLASLFEEYDGNIDVECYYKTGNDDIVGKGDILIGLGILTSESNYKTILDEISGIFTSYFLSLRIGNYYCSLLWEGVDIEGPDWQDIIEYMESELDKIVKEEFLVKTEKYIDILEEEENIYGQNSRMTSFLIKEYVKTLS
jgi:hypothetical protein